MSWKRKLVLAAVICLAWATASRAAPGDDEKKDAPKKDEAAPAAPLPAFVGHKKCKTCHFKQHKSWKKMKHAKAWNVLQEKYRVASAADKDGRACIGCHVTGYGKADQGGFVDVETSKHLLGVQCEACHGPGSAHADAARGLEEIKGPDGKLKKRFAPDADTHILLKTSACTDCHNPHVNHEKFTEEAEKEAAAKAAKKK